MIRKIWLVVGETGEYSDRVEWNVSAFTMEELANDFRDLCQAEADKCNSGTKDRIVRSSFKHPHDMQFRCDDNGTDYRVSMVNLFSSPQPDNTL